MTVLDRFLDPLTDCLTPDVARRIVDLKIDPSLQSRLDELAQKANAGTLSAEELQEYEEYVDGIELVAILKAKARRSLVRHSS
ncbi:MAG TPA: hypothetical protein VMR25_19870 [Planctomycetaceae bacterium]|jgi:hypothetical protein|nr:hypothetical protein [Planctomycetaceae bacterium]